MYRGKYESGKTAPASQKASKPVPAPRTAPEKSHQIEEIKIPTLDELNDIPEAETVVPSHEEAKAEKPKKVKEKRRPRIGGIIFYCFYFLLVLAIAGGIYYGLGLMSDWLNNFETSQPHAKSQQLFDQLFADPDWDALYQMAGPEDTKFESKDAFIQYMEQKVGDQSLTYKETSAGLSGGQKYILRLGEENIGTFTMTNSVTDDLDIPQWELDKVELFVSYDEHVTLTLRQGRNVTVNGVTLDGSYIIRTTSTVAEEYLPEGVHGMNSATYYVDGFLVAPEVIAKDADGNVIELAYDPESHTYMEAIDAETFEMPNDAKTAIIDGAQTYCKYMINAAGKAQLKQKFDPDSSTYKSITGSDLWTVQAYSRYAFTDPTVTEYYRYSDDLFSARVALDMNITRTNGSIKTFSLDTTFFLEKIDGVWLVTDMTNIDVQKVLSKVRITYMLDDAVVQTGMVDVESSVLKIPEVSVPEGKVFAGWFLESKDANGDTTMTMAFSPEQIGNVLIPSNYTLEPMVLHAMFENQGE